MTSWVKSTDIVIGTVRVLIGLAVIALVLTMGYGVSYLFPPEPEPAQVPVLALAIWGVVIASISVFVSALIICLAYNVGRAVWK